MLLSAKAQKNDTLKGLAADTLVFTVVEHEPEFEGGMNKFYAYVVRTIRIPQYAHDHNIQGKVIVGFIVEKDGSLSHFKIYKSASTDLDEEAIRVMKHSPKWQPGVQNGQPVRVSYSVPINFNWSKG
jgi:periplasmic protein TonB